VVERGIKFAFIDHTCILMVIPSRKNWSLLQPKWKPLLCTKHQKEYVWIVQKSLKANLNITYRKEEMITGMLTIALCAERFKRLLG